MVQSLKEISQRCGMPYYDESEGTGKDDLMALASMPCLNGLVVHGMERSRSSVGSLASQRGLNRTQHSGSGGTSR